MNTHLLLSLPLNCNAKQFPMGVDYYYLLDLNAGATQKEIHKAYRRLALQYHPLRNRDKPDQTECFLWVSEAYEVLSDPELRARYDQFGEEGLKHGVPGINGCPVKYVYHGDSYRTFQNYFGGPNPFIEWPEEMERENAMNFGRVDGRGYPKKGDPIEVDLECTMEEIYNGCIKKMTITHRVFDKFCHTTEMKTKVLTIIVSEGWREGTRITFAEEGDQGPNTIPGDVIFRLKAKEHPVFRRDGINLHHTTKIPIGQALLGCIIPLTTLDGRKIRIPITQVVDPKYVKVVKGEGMPDSCNPGKKGDLLIDFEHIFPHKLTESQRLNTEAALYRDGDVLKYI